MVTALVHRQGYAAANVKYARPSRLPATRLFWPRLSSISSMNRAGSSGDVVPMGMPGDPRRWLPADSAAPAPHLPHLHSSTQQQQPHPYAPTTMAITAEATAPASFDYSRISYAPLPVAAEVTQMPQPAAAGATAAPVGALMHVHAPFLVLMGYLGAMAALATNADWHMDCAWFAGIWAGLWVACCRLRPSPRTVVLLNLVPVMHMSGALGTYHWELGNLSWDILTHITNGFIGTLLFASCLGDMSAAHNAAHAAASHHDQHSSAAAAAGYDATHSTSAAAAAAPNFFLQGSWRKKAWGVLQLSLLLLAGTSLIEVLEACGGVLAGQGEGIFLRGAGDFCTASLPCSEEVDTMKDMVDNIAGMMLALLALATGSRGSSSTGKA